MVIFDNPNYQKYNGIYTAGDVGGGVKGNRLDFFMGDFRSNKAHSSTMDFGRTTAKVKVLK